MGWPAMAPLFEVPASIQLHNFGILFLLILIVLVDTVGDIGPQLGQYLHHLPSQEAISSSGMGHFSRTFDTAPSDEAIQNECKYYEVDQVLFEEKLVPRDTASGRHVSSSRSRGHEEPGTDVDNTDDKPARPLREPS